MKIKTTSLTVSDITLHAYHGVTPEERAVGTEFKVTVRLDFDAAAAMRYDDLNATINYAVAIDIVHDTMLETSQLIENAAWRIAARLLEAFPTLAGGSVAVTKVRPPVATPTAGATFTAEFTR